MRMPTPSCRYLLSCRCRMTCFLLGQMTPCCPYGSAQELRYVSRRRARAARARDSCACTRQRPCTRNMPAAHYKHTVELVTGMRLQEFGRVHANMEHGGAVRALTRIPASSAFPQGGVASGCADKCIRLFTMDDTLQLTQHSVLTGHTGGVLSLSWTADGKLLSGSWDGTARVWDVASGTCVHVLEGHENGTCVVGLPNGNIVVGSTGRKNEANQHVDYKLRVWTLDTITVPSAPAYVSCHTQS
ncbi:hypothetical protein EON62_01325 [archaeon]|nr:MAG: hypothetical protein EON62_01325 [archaeon]